MCSGFHLHPQGGARPLPGGVGTGRTFRTPRERADPNPEAQDGVGSGPLLTAAEPAAVAGLVEGAAGAAHRGGADAGESEAPRASAATCPSPTRCRPSEPPAALELPVFCQFSRGAPACGCAPRQQREPCRARAVREQTASKQKRAGMGAWRAEGGRCAKGREEKGL